MNDFIAKFTPADFIACLLIAGCIVLKLNGSDGTTTSILGAAAFWYFGARVHGLKKPDEPQ